jgi:hypothetical protein
MLPLSYFVKLQFNAVSCYLESNTQPIESSFIGPLGCPRENPYTHADYSAEVLTLSFSYLNYFHVNDNFTLVFSTYS